MRRGGAALWLAPALAFSLAAAPSLPASVGVTVAVRIPDRPDLAGIKGRAVLTPVSGGAAAALSRELELPGQTSFDVPPGTGWLLSVEAQGFWAPAEPVGILNEAQATILDLVPAGHLAGEIRVPAGLPPPRQLEVRFRPSPRASSPRQAAAVSCPVSEGRFECKVPAGELDLRLRARGYLTQYRWGAKLAPRGTYAVGRLDLKPGTSVVGWVQAPSHDFRFADCKVEISPEAAWSPSPSDRERREALAERAAVNSRGFFSFEGLVPGSYMLVVRHPGYAPGRITPLRVSAGAETEIRGITLERAVQLQVHLDPPRSPPGAVWILELLKPAPGNGPLATVAKGPASGEGIWTADDLEPGTYLASVEGRYGATWAMEPMEVLPDMSPHEIHLPFRQVRGVVTSGGEPLRSWLYFGGRHGTPEIPVLADVKGHFEATLPEGKKSWRVEVVNSTLHIDSTVTGVEVPRENRLIRIELPDTAVRGEVVDEDGQAVEGAQVRAVAQLSLAEAAGFAGATGDRSPEPGDENHATVTVTSGAQGAFELRAIDPGPWRLEATAKSGADGLGSDLVPVEVSKDHPVDQLRLVLRRRVHLRGMVVSPDGEGVPGAHLSALLEDPTHRFTATVPEANTDIAGTFDLLVPGGAEGVQLTVYPPGFAVKVLRVDVGEQSPLVVPVSPLGGTLTLAFPSSEVQSRAQLTNSWLFGDYEVGTIYGLASWAQVNGVAAADPHHFVIPMLEPGSYTACFDVGPLVDGNGLRPSGREPLCLR